jgi:hypothetical protein
LSGASTAGSASVTDAPPKRPWFQFHLSTAIVLMFVAAGLMWLNVTLGELRSLSQWKAYPGSVQLEDNGPCYSRMYYRGRGWPFSFCRVTFFNTPTSIPQTDTEAPFVNEFEDSGTLAINLVADLALSVTLLLAVAFCCERVIRLREREHG